MKTQKPILEIIKYEIRHGTETRYRISQVTGIEQSILCKIMQGGSCKAETVDVLLKHFGYKIVKE